MASSNGDGAVRYMWDESPEVMQLQQHFGVDSQGRTVHNMPGVPAEELNAGLPQEDLPGYDPEEVLAKPHRELTFEECERYGLPAGTVIMATPEEAARGGHINPIPAPQTELTPTAQVQHFMDTNGLDVWRGGGAPTFAHNGEPVPMNLLQKNGITNPQNPGRGSSRMGSMSPQHPRMGSMSPQHTRMGNMGPQHGPAPYFGGAQDRSIYKGAH